MPISVSVPEMKKGNEALQKAVLVESTAFWRGEALGRSDPTAWEESQRLMRQIGLLDAEVPVEKLFTNEFVGR